MKEELEFPIFNAPVGSAKEYWCNEHIGTTGEVTCEACGTNYPEEPLGSDGHSLNQVLGLQVLSDCCGGMIDKLYSEWGEDFAIKFVQEFANNPLYPKFTLLRMTLKNELKKAQQSILEAESEFAQNQKNLSALNEKSPLP